nr:uncharacterized protein LOC120362135 [Saimiri boliviensis boliviensis]
MPGACRAPAAKRGSPLQALGPRLAGPTGAPRRGACELWAIVSPEAGGERCFQMQPPRQHPARRDSGRPSGYSTFGTARTPGSPPGLLGTAQARVPTLTPVPLSFFSSLPRITKPVFLRRNLPGCAVVYSANLC